MKILSIFFLLAGIGFAGLAIYALMTAWLVDDMETITVGFIMFYFFAFISGASFYGRGMIKETNE